MPIQKQTWSGRPVQHERTTLDKAEMFIPNFKRENFGTNEYLDVIRNETDGQPVATVSKNYALIQHHEVIGELRETFSELGSDTSKLKTDLHLTEYGERMWLNISTPEILSFDPGDGHPLELQFRAMNSVDGSLRLLLIAGWHRLICSNGMIQLKQLQTAERRHTKSLDVESLKESVEESLSEMKHEPEVYQKWHNAERGNWVIESWIRNTVRDTWGNSLAARTHHIIKTGYDGKVSPIDLRDNKLKFTPELMKITPAEKVPGQPEQNSKQYSTKYDLLNAITFLASHQDSLTARNKMMMDVPKIIDKI